MLKILITLTTLTSIVTPKCHPGIKIEYFTDPRCTKKNPSKPALVYKKQHMHELDNCYRLRDANRVMYYKTFCDEYGFYRGIYDDEFCQSEQMARTYDTDWGSCQHIGSGAYLKATSAMAMKASAAAIAAISAFMSSQF